MKSKLIILSMTILLCANAYVYAHDGEDRSQSKSSGPSQGFIDYNRPLIDYQPGTYTKEVEDAGGKKGNISHEGHDKSAAEKERDKLISAVIIIICAILLFICVYLFFNKVWNPGKRRQ